MIRFMIDETKIRKEKLPNTIKLISDFINNICGECYIDSENVYIMREWLK